MIEPTDRLPVKSLQWTLNASRLQAMRILSNLDLPVENGEDGSTFTSKTALREAMLRAAGIA